MRLQERAWYGEASAGVPACEETEDSLDEVDDELEDDVEEEIEEDDDADDVAGGSRPILRKISRCCSTRHCAFSRPDMRLLQIC